MPSNPKSLRVTDAYRKWIVRERKAAQLRARTLWPTIEEFSNTDWAERMAAHLRSRQELGVRLSGSYLAAFTAAETGVKVPPRPVDATKYVGRSRDGRPLEEALEAPLIEVRSKLAAGASVPDALRAGLSRAERIVGVEFDYAHRQSLLDRMDEDPLVKGHVRAVGGTCGACAAAANGSVESGTQFHVHPNCQCVSEPAIDPQAAREREVKRAEAQLDAVVKSAGAHPAKKYVPLEEGVGGQMSRKTGVMSITNSESFPPQAIASTVHHEFGHAIDYKKLTGAAYHDARKARKTLLREIRRTDAVKELREIAKGLTGGNKSYLKYLLSEDELVARAFQAYMAKTSPEAAKSARTLWGLMPDTPTNKRLAKALAFEGDDLTAVEEALKAFVKAKGY